MRKMQRRVDNLKKIIPITSVSLIVIILDYITKWIIIENVQPHEYIDVFPFLRIVHVENEGAAFGLFSQLGNSVFIIISVCAIIFIFVYLWRVSSGAELYAMSLILGGATGNLIDRVIAGKVVDFIDVYYNKWHWPAFNIADSALTVGILLFLWANIFRGRH